MKDLYQVQKDGESLAARLIDDGKRSIEITYRNPRGDSQVALYRNGMEVSKRATLACGLTLSYADKDKSSLIGYLAGYDRLGPELRTQIPSDWHSVLGAWLAPKDKPEGVLTGNTPGLLDSKCAGMTPAQAAAILDAVDRMPGDLGKRCN